MLLRKMWSERQLPRWRLIVGDDSGFAVVISVVFALTLSLFKSKGAISPTCFLPSIRSRTKTNT